MHSPPPLFHFYKSKRVLVTGHTGFKGSWLCLALLKMDCTVAGIALPPEESPDSLFQLSGLSSRLQSHYADIRDLPALQAFTQAFKPDIIFHMAAQSLVLHSYEAPIDTFATNVMGTAHLLEAARQTPGVKAVVNVTTDKCYENNETGAAFHETDRLGGHDPYSASKAAAEIISASYRKSFLADAGIAMATARAGNVIGGGDFSKNRLIPDIVRAIKSDQPIHLRHPESVRPWQHVLDVLYGYLLLGQALYEEGAAFAEPFNFGPDEAGITVGTVADQLISAVGHSPKLTRGETMTSAHEAKNLYLDNRKAKAALGWNPIMNPQEAIASTADWYKYYLTQANSIASFTEEQLIAHMKKWRSRLPEHRMAS
jgi:CDP-glucose 4,6-dehydratase